MKNIALTFLLSILIITGYSNNTARLKKLHYENSLGEKGVTYFYYSLENKNYKAKWELLDGSRHSINYHFLDENGNLIRKYREFSDTITSNNFYKYDEQGNLIEDYFERSDKVKGIVWYTYKQGKKVKAECRGMNGWFYGIINYECVNNQINKGIIYQSGGKVGTIKYTYDTKGNLLTEYWDFGNWNQKFTYEYEIPQNTQPEFYSYSSPFLNPTVNFLVQEENYNWNSEQGGPSFYEYDRNKLIRKVYRYDTLETITTYEYDEQGLLMKSFRNYSDGRKAEFSYHYNEDKRLVRRLFHGENGFVGTESYVYDNIGNLIDAKWIKFDSWISGEIAFTYEKGILSQGIFKADKYEATIDFSFDKNKNLSKIFWNFSFGKTQTYEFKYSKWSDN